MQALLAFIRLTRPLFLAGGFAGVALGAAVAAWRGCRIDVATYVWVQALVTSFHLMVHYANDYFDRHGDGSGRRTAWSGGSGMLLDGALPPHAALVAALVCAALGLAFVARFAAAGNGAVAVAGVAVGVFAWAYSAPPVRLAARGLGELDTALVVAVLVPCTGYAAFAHRVDAPILGAVVAPAVAMLVMMFAVELPDADADLLAGKRTLVVRLGTLRSWLALVALATLALTLTLGDALRLRLPLAALAVVPAAAAALALIVRVLRDPRPATIAFLGVALYGLTSIGLAGAYGAAARWAPAGEGGSVVARERVRGAQ